MAFEKNSVLRATDGKTIRILWAHGSEEMVWVIDIHDPLAWPIIMSRTDLVSSVVNNELIPIGDEILNSLPSDDELSESERAVRDKAWRFISELVKNECEIYTSKKRAQLVSLVCKDFEVSRQTIYKYLRRFWQRGNVPNALIPDYTNCGARGQNKSVSDKKRGRPRSIAPGTGINITPDIVRHFRVAISRKYLSSNKSQMKSAFNWMLATFFTEAVRLVRTSHATYDVSIIKPDEIPTFEQFTYYLHQENNFAAIRLSRLGRRAFEKKYRALLNSSLNEVEGPGSRYQIDATIIDVYVVSRFDRNKIVGRPTLYIVTDVFSRLIVGCYVGLEHPSWMCAMMALLNTVQDKVEFCKKYDIEIEPEDWPVAELPLKLLGDRGEMESIIASRLVLAFRIELENAAPYRGDAKGLVERIFRTLHAVYGEFVPGFVEQDFKERGGRDYRLDAKLTLDEITRIIIHSILLINATNRRDYPLLPEAVKDGVSYAPIELWNWGKENLRTDTRPFDYQYTLLNLLPSEKIVVHRRGLKFSKGLYYVSAELMAEPWYLAAQDEKMELIASYHPGDMSRVYIRTPHDRTKHYTAELAPHCKALYGKTYVEIDAIRKRERQIVAERKSDLTAKQIAHQLNVNAIVATAEAAYKDDYDPSLSDAERKRSIKSNRVHEQRQNIRGIHENLGLPNPNSSQADISATYQPDADDASENELIKSMRRRRQSLEQ